MSIDDLCPHPPSLRDLSIPALVHLRDQVVAELASRRASTPAEVVRLYPSNDGRYHRVGHPYRREDGALVVDCVARSPYEATGDRDDER